MSSNMQLYKILKSLCDVYALYWMNKNSSEFFMAKCIGPEQMAKLLDEVKGLCLELRPNAVGIVDSFGFTDNLLNSVLGRYDGFAYEALFNSVLEDPLNKRDVSEGYYRNIQYILHPERKRSFTNSRL